MSKENLYVFQELKSGVPDGFVTHIDQVRDADMLSRMVNITYSELLLLTRNNNLIPGRQYRITDFVTTCNAAGSVSGVTTRSAGNAFDIVVVADSTNTLNENARAVLHDGDAYFATSNLAAWQIKYSIDNDTSRFAWAVSDGKGVIYYMKDEFNNECFYDFKNIQYLKDDKYHYTFSIITQSMFDTSVFTLYDGSIILGTLALQNCCNNKISVYKTPQSPTQRLNNIILSSEQMINEWMDLCSFVCINNYIEETCHSLYLPKASFNHIGQNCYNIDAIVNFSFNHIGQNCYNIRNMSSLTYTTIANNCHVLFDNFGDIERITVGENCSGIKATENYYPRLTMCSIGKNCINFTLDGTNNNVDWVDYYFDDNIRGEVSNPIIIINPEGTTNSGSYKKYKTKIATNSTGDIKIYCEADLIA